MSDAPGNRFRDLWADSWHDRETGKSSFSKAMSSLASIAFVGQLFTVPFWRGDMHWATVLAVNISAGILVYGFTAWRSWIKKVTTSGVLEKAIEQAAKSRLPSAEPAV